MLNTIPLELRETIYALLLHAQPSPLPNEPRKVTITHLDGVSWYPKTLSPCTTKPIDWRNTPFAWDTSYVNVDFYREIVECWYRTSIFEFEWQYALIVPFIENQLAGVDPAKCVQHVRVSIDAFNIQQDQVPHFTGTQRGMLDADELVEQLRYLFRFKRGAMLRINVNVSDQVSTFGGPYGSAAWRRVFGILWQVLEELHARGYILEVVCDSRVVLTNRDAVFSIDAWMEKLDKNVGLWTMLNYEDGERGCSS
jgi:hypothetical protein